MMSDKKNVKWIRFDDEMLQSIESYQRAHSPVPTFTEAVRQLLEFALAAKGHAPQ